MDNNNALNHAPDINAPERAQRISVVNASLPTTTLSDTRPTQMPADGVQRPSHSPQMTDTDGQRPPNENGKVGHDSDLPDRSIRHGLSTYEASRLFEEAECRVSERTIIRWCNRNKRGQRRLDCAFEPNERKYYISEESVKGVIREERTKGRQSELYNPDLSDIENGQDEVIENSQEDVGQRPTATDTKEKHSSSVTDDDGRTEATLADTIQAGRQEEAMKILDENTRLKIELAKHEEQAKTKDEMMTFLRKEIDRRGETIEQDRETYSKSLDWFKLQVEEKDSLIEKLNTDVRGLLEAPRNESNSIIVPRTQSETHDVEMENVIDEQGRRDWQHP